MLLWIIVDLGYAEKAHTENQRWPEWNNSKDINNGLTGNQDFEFVKSGDK